MAVEGSIFHPLKLLELISKLLNVGEHQKQYHHEKLYYRKTKEDHMPQQQKFENNDD
jgi:hypothetical protein